MELDRSGALPAARSVGPETGAGPTRPDGGLNAGPDAGPKRRPGVVALGVLRTLRVKQWTKNVLVFAAPGAAGVLTHRVALEHALAAFALFCAVAGGTYLLNDGLDADADRLHPTKRNRPVAAGIVSVRTAVAVAVVLMAGSVALGALLRFQLGLILGVYVAVQIAYSSYLKHLPVYDLTSVAAGFLLRSIAGAVAVPVAVSEWFLIVTTFGSLLMVTGKRLAEHAELGEGRGGHRATLDAYSTTFLRIVVALAATGAVVGYSLWAFSLQAAQAHHHREIFFQLSIVPILLGLLHFTFLIDSGKGARPEDLVLHDRQLQLLGAVWAILFGLGVYL